MLQVVPAAATPQFPAAVQLAFICVSPEQESQSSPTELHSSLVLLHPQTPVQIPEPHPPPYSPAGVTHVPAQQNEDPPVQELPSSPVKTAQT